MAILGEPVNVPQGVGATRIGKYHHYAQVAVQGDDVGQLSGWAARASLAGWAGWADWASWAELLSSRTYTLTIDKTIFANCPLYGSSILF